MRRKKKVKIDTYKKIVVRLNIDAYNRFVAIRCKYGYNSIYEIMQHLTAFFIRVFDPIPEEEKELSPIPEEIEMIFTCMRNSVHFASVKPQRIIVDRVDVKNGQLQLPFNKDNYDVNKKILCGEIFDESDTLRRQIAVRVDTYSFDRLMKIKNNQGFNSIYELIQYVAACFLRFADPNTNECKSEVEEVEEMFDVYSSYEKHFEYQKPKRAMNNKTLNQYSSHDTN